MTAHTRDASAADLSPDWVIEPYAPETVRAARLQVCSRADDAEGAAELLDALGIGADMPSPYVTTRGGVVHVEGCRRLRPVHERWPWVAGNDGPGVARACGTCLAGGLPS